LCAGGRGPNPKRLSKDSKYGFGGPKRAGKRNDSASAANMDDFKQSRPQGRGRGALHIKPSTTLYLLEMNMTFGLIQKPKY